MRILQAIATILCFLLAAAAGRADMLLLTVTGTITSLDSPWDDSVTIGTPITATFQIDTDAPNYDGGPTLGTYYAGPGTVAMGDYSATASSETQVFAYSGGATAGYTFSSYFASLEGQSFSINADFFFTDPSKVPDSLLSTLPSSLGTASVSDLSSPTLYLYATDSNGVNANITSFSLTAIPAPEPGTWTLLAAGTGALALLGRRRARS